MIKIENVSVHGFEEAIRGMRNPMNSWDRSDSYILRKDGTGFQIGPNDKDLAMRLATAGAVHGKYRRMITVYADITAPLYWWKEFDTYKVGTVANSCSTMHKIADKEFTLDDFSCEHLTEAATDRLMDVIDILNEYRSRYKNYDPKIGDIDVDIKCKKDLWWQMIQLLPSSYNQRRTVMMNYEVLAGIWEYRINHKLDEWREFCEWIEGLPYSEIILTSSGGEESDA